MSRVMLMEACPGISETTLGLTLLRSSAADTRPDPPNFGKPAYAPNHVLPYRRTSGNPFRAKLAVLLVYALW